MLRTTLVLMPVCMALAACNEMDPNISNKTPEEIYGEPPPFDGTITLTDGTKQPISETKPLTGDYDFITETRDIAAEEMGFGSPINRRQNRQTCLGEDDVERGYESLIVIDSSDETCKYESFAIVDGKLNSVMRCVADEMDLTFETTGTVGPQQSEWTTMVTGRNALGMTENVEEKVTLKRIKDC